MKKNTQNKKKKNIAGRMLVGSILVGGLALGGFYGADYLRKKDNLIAEQTDRIVEQNSTIDELTLQNTNLGAQIATLQSQKLILEGERDAALSTLNTRTAERDAEIALKNQALADKDAALAEANRLTGVIAEVNEEKAELESELADELLSNSQNRQIINALEADIVALNNIKSGLENSLATALADVTTLEGQILAHQNTINQKNAEITTLNQSVTSLNSQINTLNSNISTLQNKLTTAESVMNFLIEPMQYELRPTVQNNILNFEPLFNALSIFNTKYDVKIDGVLVAEGTQNYTIDLSSITNGIASEHLAEVRPNVEYDGLKYYAPWNFNFFFLSTGILQSPIIYIDYEQNFAYIETTTAAISYDFKILDDIGNLLFTGNFSPYQGEIDLSAYNMKNGYLIEIQAIGNDWNILNSEVAIAEYLQVEKIQLVVPNIDINFETKTMILPELEGLREYELVFWNSAGDFLGWDLVQPGTYTYNHELSEGDKITIRADGNDSTHTNSERVEYIVTFQSQLERLIVPTPLEVNLATQELIIPTVANATGYRVILNNSITETVDATATTFSLASYNLENNSIIELFALGDGITYADSEGVRYLLEYQQLATPTISYNAETHLLTISNIDPIILNRTDDWAGYAGIVYEYLTNLQGYKQIINGIITTDISQILHIVDGMTEDGEFPISVRMLGLGYYLGSASSNSVNYIYDWYESDKIQHSAPVISYSEETQILNITFTSVPDSFGYKWNLYSSLDGVSYSKVIGTGGSGGNNTFSTRIKTKALPSGNYYFAVVQVGDAKEYLTSEYSNTVFGLYAVTPLNTPVLNYDEETETLSWIPQIVNGVEQSYYLEIYYSGTQNQANHLYVVGGSILISELSLDAGTYDFYISAMAKDDAYGYINATETSNTITLQIN